MLNGNVFYHGSIRKSIVAFGKLFSNIYIDRKQDDSVGGDTVQRLHVPIAYAPKEKWLVRIDEDPTLENQVYTTLPRMSFEVTGMVYDSTRKINRMNAISKYIDETPQSKKRVFTPVPYNLDVTLYILAKTQEDALQIVEQILPTFTPEYTMALNVLPEMDQVQDLSINLSSVSVQDDYDGDFQTRRFVTYTLTFILKTNIYGPVVSRGVIKDVQIDTTYTDYQATQESIDNDIIEGWNDD